MMLELFGAPWLITESSLKTIIAIASRDTFFADARKQALEARDGTPLKNARSAYKRGAVAVIPVVGPLIRHADMFSEISGATSYAALRKDLQVALDDFNVSSILFNVDSPGGEANGCFELADAIFAARKVKPVRAYVGGMGASAAYAIACACEDITCAASAELGSIGVRAGYLDASKAYEQAGLKEWTFVSSQSPYKAFDVNVDDDRARLQVVLDDLAQVFVEQVARNRDVDVDDVLSDFGKGDVMVGARAIAAGLADQVGDFEALIAEMQQQAGAQPTDAFRVAAKVKRMAIKAEPVIPAPTASVSNEKCDGCGSKMAGNSYCQSCYDGDDDETEDDDEDAKALGVDKSTSRADRRGRMAALLDFEQKVLATTDRTTPAAAVTRIVNGMAALAERDQLRAAEEERAKQALHGKYVAALSDPRLSLVHLSKMAPAFISSAPNKDKDGKALPSDRELVRAAIEGLESQTQAGLVSALSLAKATPELVEQLSAIADAQGPAPTINEQPPLDSANRNAVVSASKAELARFGISQESLNKYANVHSVADLPAQKGQ